jgi:hypothetical protein
VAGTTPTESYTTVEITNIGGSSGGFNPGTNSRGGNPGGDGVTAIPSNGLSSVTENWP